MNENLIITALLQRTNNSMYHTPILMNIWTAWHWHTLLHSILMTQIIIPTNSYNSARGKKRGIIKSKKFYLKLFFTFLIFFCHYYYKAIICYANFCVSLVFSSSCFCVCKEIFLEFFFYWGHWTLCRLSVRLSCMYGKEKRWW